MRGCKGSLLRFFVTIVTILESGAAWTASRPRRWCSTGVLAAALSLTVIACDQSSGSSPEHGQDRCQDGAMEGKKPLACRLGRHRYRLRYNDGGQDYYPCERCEKYRDSFHLTDSSGGIA